MDRASAEIDARAEGEFGADGGFLGFILGQDGEQGAFAEGNGAGFTVEEGYDGGGTRGSSIMGEQVDASVERNGCGGGECAGVGDGFPYDGDVAAIC